MPKNPNIIRVGDRIRVDNPQFFIRVGYAKCLDSESEVVHEQFAHDINDLLIKTGLPMHSGLSERYYRTLQRIEREIAYARLKQFGMGGDRREIYTREVPEFAGKEYKVQGIRFVKTGKYYSPSSGYSYDGEYDYEPGGLEDQKTHKLLELDSWFFPPGMGTDLVTIEACHVTKIQSATNHLSLASL